MAKYKSKLHLNDSAKDKHEKNQLIARDGHDCHYCGVTLRRDDMTRDHVIPHAFGGKDMLTNKVIACDDCNTFKADKLNVCHCDFCTKAHNDHKWLWE